MPQITTPLWPLPLMVSALLVEPLANSGALDAKKKSLLMARRTALDQLETEEAATAEHRVPQERPRSVSQPLTQEADMSMRTAQQRADREDFRERSTPRAEVTHRTLQLPRALRPMCQPKVQPSAGMVEMLMAQGEHR